MLRTAAVSRRYITEHLHLCIPLSLMRYTRARNTHLQGHRTALTLVQTYSDNTEVEPSARVDRLTHCFLRHHRGLNL